MGFQALFGSWQAGRGGVLFGSLTPTLSTLDAGAVRSGGIGYSQCLQSRASESIRQALKLLLRGRVSIKEPSSLRMGVKTCLLARVAS